jgi:parvulin-like peptidyl-prolyl isomerase
LRRLVKLSLTDYVNPGGVSGCASRGHANDEIRRYYDAHAQDFNRPAGVFVREITILTRNREPEQIERQRKKAEAALAAVKNGSDFAAVAANFSESLTAPGPDWGFGVKGTFGELEEVVNKLEKGEVSDVIQVEGAFMIIKVDDVHLGGVLPFELAKKEIGEILFRQAVKPKTREYLAKLRASGRR